MGVGSGKKKKMWSARVKAWRCSGLSQNEYCWRNHLTSHQFCYWKKVLTAEQTPEANPFVPVLLPKTTKQHPISAMGVTIRLVSGIKIEIDREFDSAVLIQAVTALEGLL